MERCRYWENLPQCTVHVELCKRSFVEVNEKSWSVDKIGEVASSVGIEKELQCQGQNTDP